MARGFKHGSGGCALNFRVTAGASMPQNPGENTIFVETGAPMSRWAFAGVDPGPVEEGLVWIVTGTYSDADFLAIDSGGILLISPLEARQYVAGAWVTRNAWIYKQGIWVSLGVGNSVTLLYDAGNQYPALTGGWTGELWTYNQYGVENGTVADTYLKVKGGHTGSSGKASVVGTAEKVLISGMKTLKAEVNVTSAGIIGFSLYDSRDAEQTLNGVTVQTVGAHTMSIDVTGVSGSYYVAFYAFGSQSAGTTPTAEITKVWLGA